MEFYKDKKISDKVIIKFTIMNHEMEFLEKGKFSFHELEKVKKFWREVPEPIMEYFTLDGRYTKIRGYFCHKAFIFFPFYFMPALNSVLSFTSVTLSGRFYTRALFSLSVNIFE